MRTYKNEGGQKQLSVLKICGGVSKKRLRKLLSKAKFGRAKPLKSELRRRGIWQGFVPHVPDDWGRQLAAGTSVHNETTQNTLLYGNQNIF